ncbi:5-oxoprolinase subunit C family protein [Tautonia rosea]|uniref:5-oxoprolinase subunit C family protein n=1 Tax=Tautonia rosea TaxID=2728037 RepID=UPI0014755A5F|nr:biotin-dependent carboxyltransferase family protein [Tautonia rosea]
MSDSELIAQCALTILRAGANSTVQDLGRSGYRSQGVPHAGAFDRSSHDLANALLGNELEAATIELTLLGGTFRAEVPLALALAGAPMPVVRQRPDGTRDQFEVPVALGLQPGDFLELGGVATGVRTYLAVRGGWQTLQVLGSRSTEHPLRAGDCLPAIPSRSPVRRIDPLLRDPIKPEAPIRIMAGPDHGLIRDPCWHRQPFTVAGESNRMGLRLDGPDVEVSIPSDRLSVPVAPGTVQVSGGRLIILGVACGTMGGYPMVAHVASCDFDRLAQARPGQVIRFDRIDVQEARRLDRAERLRREQRRLRVVTLARDGLI